MSILRETEPDPNESNVAHDPRVLAGAGLEHPAPVNQTAHKPEATVQRSSGPVHIKLDGVAKNLPAPVTGTALYRLAGQMPGHSVTVKSGSGVVPNNDEFVEVKDGQEFTTK